MERFAQGFAVLCYTSILGNLAILSKDRHQAVSNPLLYRSNVTRSRVIKKTSGVWVFSEMMWVLVYVSQYFTFTYFPIPAIAVLVYVICIVIIISSYGGILIANKRHRQALDQRAGRMLATLKREKKLAITVGLILIVLCVSFLPALISPLVLSILGFSGTDFIPFMPFCAVFISLNGLLNPLLNFGRNEDVRQAVLGLIRVFKRAKRVQPDSSDSSRGTTPAPLWPCSYSACIRTMNLYTSTPRPDSFLSSIFVTFVGTLVACMNVFVKPAFYFDSTF